MKTLLNSYSASIVLVVCIIVFYLANNKNFFGEIINNFMSCVQDPASSFPCYGVYNITAMILAMVIGSICIGLLGSNLFRLIVK